MDSNYSNSFYSSNALFNIGVLAWIMSTVGYHLPQNTNASKGFLYKKVTARVYYSPVVMENTFLLPNSKEHVFFNFDLSRMESMLDCDFIAIPDKIKKAADIKAWILSQKV